jgi:FkbM family methyltransferase
VDVVQHVPEKDTIMIMQAARYLRTRIGGLLGARAHGERLVSADIPGLGSLEFFLHSERDIWISDVIERGEVFDRHILRVMQALIAEGDTFIDAGANIGWFSVIGSRLVGKKGRVLAFEPSLPNMDLLKKNVARNNCRNVLHYPVALGAKKTTALLFLSADNQGDHRLATMPLGRDSVNVEVIPLDDVLATLPPREGAGNVFVKIDTQGSETSVLSGMRALLSSGRQIRIVMEFWPHGLESCGSSTGELLEELNRAPWKVWVVHPDGMFEESSLAGLHALSRSVHFVSNQGFVDVLLLPMGDYAGHRVISGDI